MESEEASKVEDKRALESEEAPKVEDKDTEVSNIPEPEKKAAMPDAPIKVAVKSKDNKLARRIRGEGV